MSLSLYKEYIQKSRIFLYPALQFKRGSGVTPIQTYSSWQGQYTLEDYKLSCVYYLREDEEFKNYEKNRLLSHEMFCDFKMLEDDKGVYVFDFKKHKQDWDYFVSGKYSKISNDLKRKIQNFFGVSNQGIIDCYLYPERYFKIYAELLIADQGDLSQMLKLLKEVGELCSKPDFEQENLVAEIKNLHIFKKLN